MNKHADMPLMFFFLIYRREKTPSAKETVRFPKFSVKHLENTEMEWETQFKLWCVQNQMRSKWTDYYIGKKDELLTDWEGRIITFFSLSKQILKTSTVKHHTQLLYIDLNYSRNNSQPLLYPAATHMKKKKNQETAACYKHGPAAFPGQIKTDALFSLWTVDSHAG